jgi:peptide/nickel transport system substrate-binding protein
MNAKKLLIVIVTCLLVTGTFAMIPVFSAQPPIDTSYYYIGTISQPRNVDPVRCYDTASGELIMNVYDSLIFFNQSGQYAPYLPPETSKVNDSNLAALADFKPVLATTLPDVVAVQGSGSNWTFTIDTTKTFADWTDSASVVHSGQTLTAADVVYNFQRMLVQDCSGGPQWLFLTPYIGRSYFASSVNNSYDSNVATPTLDPVGVDGVGERKAAAAIQAFMTVSGNNVTFHFLNDWPLGGLYQTFANTFGCIPPKNFCIEHGCWNGTFFDTWSTIYRRKPSSQQTPLDTHYAGYSKYSSASAEPAMCGTGPYQFTYWDKAMLQWRLDWNPTYWGGWADGPAGPHVHTILETGINAWPTRKMEFLSGEFDTCIVPRANMWDLLEPSDLSGHTAIPGIVLYWNTPALSNEIVAYTFVVDTASPYISKIAGTPAPNFFNDSHVRKAFSQALNSSAYIASAYYGEAIQPATWYIKGLSPDCENKAITAYDLNEIAIQNELTAAGLWNQNWETTIVWNSGAEARHIAAQMIANEMTVMGAKAGKTFKVNVIDMEWNTFLTAFETYQLPGWVIGWQADFADPDNFARPYMFSEGDFSYFQGYNNPTADSLITLAAVSADVNVRNSSYQTLQTIYHDDAVSLPLTQPTGRGWHRDWVRGVYVNQLYSGPYYYDRAKVVFATQPIDVDVTKTITPIVYYSQILVFHGEMRRGNGSSTAAKMTYDITVHRTDANGLVGILYTAIGLKRYNATGYREYPNATYKLLAPGGNVTVTLDWYEDGATQVITPSDWQVAGEANPVDINRTRDTNSTNNVIDDGIVQAKKLVGDINGQGVVDIYDAILLSNSFNKHSTDKGFNADADLKPDLVIDIYDAILLANNFNKRWGIWP